MKTTSKNKKGRQPQKYFKWRRPQKTKKGRQPQKKFKWRRPQRKKWRQPRKKIRQPKKNQEEGDLQRKWRRPPKKMKTTSKKDNLKNQTTLIIVNQPSICTLNPTPSVLHSQFHTLHSPSFNF